MSIINTGLKMFINGQPISMAVEGVFGFEAALDTDREQDLDPEGGPLHDEFLIHDSFAGMRLAAGSTTFTATTRWSRDDAEAFFSTFEKLLPKPEFRQRGLVIEVASGQDVTLGLPDGRSVTDKMWTDVGEARSAHTHRRLRRFVRRGDRVVEVRSRGRCGSRSLEEALREVDIRGCGGSSFSIEGGS